MKKSLPLSDDQKRTIVRYALNNKNVKASDVCRHFNITRDQYEYAMRKYNDGLLYKKSYKRTKRPPVDALVKEHTADELIEKEFSVAVAALHSDRSIDAGARIDMLHKIVATRQTMQRASLQSHIKRADSDVIAILVRILRPGSTDEEVIKYYTQAYEEYKQL